MHQQHRPDLRRLQRHPVNCRAPVFVRSTGRIDVDANLVVSLRDDPLGIRRREVNPIRLNLERVQKPRLIGALQVAQVMILAVPVDECDPVALRWFGRVVGDIVDVERGKLQGYGLRDGNTRGRELLQIADDMIDADIDDERSAVAEGATRIE
jgi:hypothetical protein